MRLEFHLNNLLYPNQMRLVKITRSEFTKLVKELSEGRTKPIGQYTFQTAPESFYFQHQNSQEETVQQYLRWYELRTLFAYALPRFDDLDCDLTATDLASQIVNK